jgi:hypothetical protein
MLDQELSKILRSGHKENDHRHRDSWNQALQKQLSDLGYASLHPLNTDSFVSTEEWLGSLKCLAASSPLVALNFLNNSTVHLLVSVSDDHRFTYQNTALSGGFYDSTDKQINFVHGQDPSYVLSWRWSEQKAQIEIASLETSATPLHGVSFGYCYQRSLAQMTKPNLIEKALPQDFANRAIQFYVMGINTIILQTLHEALRLGVSYSFERIQGGRPIIQWPEHQAQICNLIAKKDLYQQLALHHQSCDDLNPPQAPFILLAELVDKAPDLLSQSMQLFGGIGYMMDSKIESLFRASHFIASLFGSPLKIRQHVININHIKEIYA